MGHTTALFTFAMTRSFEAETRTDVRPQKQFLQWDLPGRTRTNKPWTSNMGAAAALLLCGLGLLRGGIHLLQRLAAVTDPEHEIHLINLQMFAAQVPILSRCSSESVELRRCGSCEQMYTCTLGQEELHPKNTCFFPLTQGKTQWLSPAISLPDISSSSLVFHVFQGRHTTRRTPETSQGKMELREEGRVLAMRHFAASWLTIFRDCQHLPLLQTSVCADSNHKWREDLQWILGKKTTILVQKQQDSCTEYVFVFLQRHVSCNSFLPSNNSYIPGTSPKLYWFS